MEWRKERECIFGEQLSPLDQTLRSLRTSGPAIVWTTLFLFVPLLGIVFISFMSRGSYGELQLPLTFDNYSRFFGFGSFGFDPLYPYILLRSVLLAVGSTLLCMICALPLAFFIAGLSPRYKNLALTLVMIPFWTNLLIRTYAWQMLLSAEGLVSKIAQFVGLVGEGMPLYPSLGAVYLGTLCDYLPYLVLPLYASVEKIDWTIVEAAMDLGAGRIQSFRHAVLPQIIPGLAAGIVLVFVPATGQFIVPDLLGGAKTSMLGNSIAQQFGPSRDWPFGSAIAMSGILALMFALIIYNRILAKRGGEGLL
ncbi:MAG: ABC transporter permease [Oligoflexia bacterium]|nr:ABC transporter permease [Oligoflexia bacterium]